MAQAKHTKLRKPSGTDHYPIRIFSSTLIFAFGPTLRADMLTPEQRTVLESQYRRKGFKVRWEFNTK